MPQPAQTGLPVIYQGTHATARLKFLGIKPVRLSDALDAGDRAARDADKYSPITAAGSLRWFQTVRTLLEGLVGDGWTRNDDRNVPRAIRPDENLAVLVVSGTAATGLADANPQRANPRTRGASRTVHINQMELDLADMAAEKLAKVTTYWLLYFRSEHDELRAELSLPVQVSDLGAIEGWSERILLPPRRFAAAKNLPLDRGGDHDSSFDIAAR